MYLSLQRAAASGPPAFRTAGFSRLDIEGPWRYHVEPAKAGGPRLALFATLLLTSSGVFGQDSRAESAPARLFHPTARWIWDSPEPQPLDAYRLFRKSFTLSSPADARIRITADSEYRLYVNGTYVARGPAPSPAGRASVDEIDLGRQLRAGRNAIAVVVYHLGTPSFPRMMGRAGFLAELPRPGESPVVTDASWRCNDAWWIATGERFSPMREYTEHLDGRKQAPGWADAAFDDSKWKPAVEIGPEGTEPWRVLEWREIPLPDHREVAPVSVVFKGSCDSDVPTKRDAAKALSRMPELPPRFAGHPAGTLVLHDGDVVAFDFGREVSGFPEVDVATSTDGVVIDLGYGEALDAEGRVDVLRQDLPDSDRLTLGRAHQLLRVFHHRAFRYLVLAVRGGDVLGSVRVIESGFPVSNRGSFSCSDPLLDRIWDAGRRTVATCMDQGFMDCPWRERGQYVGDSLVEGQVAQYAFGDTTLMRRFLRQAPFCQPKDGLLEPAYPSDWIGWHKEGGPNRIPGYGALWIVMLEEHFRATGDLALVKTLRPVVDRQLAWFDRYRDATGLVTSAPEWNFIDWADLKPASALACLNLQYLMALRAAATIDEALGVPATRAAEAAKVAAAFHATCWDETRGLYHDAKGVYSAHTNSLALLTLVEDPKVANRIIDGIRGADVLQPATGYFQGFVLRALAKHGRHEDALRTIRDRWGPMLAAGATTLWEAFDPRASLCHGWSAEPTAFLQRDVLGLSYDAPRGTMTFAPRLGGLAWAAGICPFVCGDAYARVVAGASGLTAHVSAPAAVTLDVDILAPSGTTLEVDGVRSDVRAEGGHLRTKLRGGVHRIVVTTR